MTFTYTDHGKEITISGFIAFLLQQGQQWDYRCMEADVKDYHQATYARMDEREALRQEIEWWSEFYQNEYLPDLPQRDYLLSEGVYYLLWQAEQVLLPIAETDKLTANMAIYLTPDTYLYKVDDTLAFFHKGEAQLETLIFGFAAQLLTYAASSTIEALLDDPTTYHPAQVVDILADWLQSPSAILLAHIHFSIPDVYQLYASYLAETKEKWEKGNKRRYQSKPIRPQDMMLQLRQQVAEEGAHAIEQLIPYLTEKQVKEYQRYLQECQQYIADHTQQPTRHTMDAYWGERATPYWKGEAVKRLKAAAQEKNPAAALALEVKKLQAEKILKMQILPYPKFAAALNSVANADVKADTLSKHFRC